VTLVQFLSVYFTAQERGWVVTEYCNCCNETAPVLSAHFVFYLLTSVTDSLAPSKPA